MKTKQKKLTANQEAFEKELKRARNFIRRAQKRGFVFQVELPDRPTRVTAKSLQNLRESLKPAALYNQALYIVPETGEAISGTEGRAMERRAAALKGAARKKAKKARAVPTPENTARAESINDRILSSFFADLERFQRAKGAAMLREWAQAVINNIGKGALAFAIYQAITAGELFLDSSLYEEEIVRSEIEALNRYLPADSAIPREIIEESLEGWETAAEDAVYREEQQV